jgi:O-acetyl-ADP-ribose deacetylase (regulator of RNase III)
MRIEHVTGDVFAHAATLPVPAVAHGVNCEGVMGKGVAKTVREYWPELYQTYRQACQSGLVAPGSFLAYRTPRGGWVYNLATQDKPGPHARIEWIIEAVEAMSRHAVSVGVSKIAIVRIGAGIGGLDWASVEAALRAATGAVTLVVVTPADVPSGASALPAPRQNAPAGR